MRKSYLDNVRWMTVVLVVVYHVIYMFNSVVTAGVLGPLSDGPQYQDLFQYAVYPWFMVLLFTVSGMAARFSLEKVSHRDFIRTRTRKLLVPSTLGLLAFWWILGYFNMKISGAFEQMGAVPKPVLFLIMCLSGTGPLWYIQLLWLYSLVLVVLRKMEKDRLYNLCGRANIWVLLGLTIPVWASAQVLNTPIIVVYRFGIYGLTFFIGYFLLSHEAVMERLDRARVPLGILAAGLLIAFCALYWQAPYAEHVVLDTPLCNVCAWIVTLAILAWMHRVGNFSGPFVRFMQKESWGLYLFHYLPLAICASLLREKVPGLAPILTYLLTAAAAFLGSFLLDAIIRRIPVLRWLVMGIKGKE